LEVKKNKKQKLLFRELDENQDCRDINGYTQVNGNLKKENVHGVVRGAKTEEEDAGKEAEKEAEKAAAAAEKSTGRANGICVAVARD
jgi:protein involved in temperature-dependent protein secretion